MIKLGALAKDKITGFTGIVIGQTIWVNGCNRVGLQSKELYEGKPVDLQWFDEAQVEEIVTPATSEIEAPAKSTGGPMPDPKRW